LIVSSVTSCIVSNVPAYSSTKSPKRRRINPFYVYYSLPTSQCSNKLPSLLLSLESYQLVARGESVKPYKCHALKTLFRSSSWCKCIPFESSKYFKVIYIYIPVKSSKYIYIYRVILHLSFDFGTYALYSHACWLRMGAQKNVWQHSFNRNRRLWEWMHIEGARAYLRIRGLVTRIMHMYSRRTYGAIFQRFENMWLQTKYRRNTRNYQNYKKSRKLIQLLLWKLSQLMIHPALFFQFRWPNEWCHSVSNHNILIKGFWWWNTGNINSWFIPHINVGSRDICNITSHALYSVHVNNFQFSTLRTVSVTVRNGPQ